MVWIRWISLFLVWVLGACGEESKQDFFIVKASGDTVYGNASIVKRTFSPDMVSIKGDSVALQSVAVIRNESGYYRNSGDIRSGTIARRTQDGKLIDRYSIETMVLGMDSGEIQLMPKSMLSLYTKGDGPLKEINYANVKIDFGDQPDSHKMIGSYRTKRLEMYLGILGGLTAVAVGIPLAKDDPKAGQIAGIAVTASMVFAIYEYFSKYSCLVKAVDLYKDE